MSQLSLRKSYLVETSHGEVYTGGPVTYHPGFRALICPQDNRVNTLTLENSGIYVFPISDEESRVVALAAHPRNGRLAVAYQSGWIKVYEPKIKTTSAAAFQNTETIDLTERKATIRYEWHEINKWKCALVTCLAWDNFDTPTPLIAASSADGTLKVFDQVGGYCTHNFRGHSSPVTFCKFDKNTSPRNTSWTIFSASQDCTVRVWSLKESKQISIISDRTSPVRDIDFINEGSQRRLVVVGLDQLISLYDMNNKFTHLISIPVYEALESCLVIPSDVLNSISNKLGLNLTTDPHVLVGGYDGILKIWNVKTSSCVYTQPGKPGQNPSIEYLFHATPGRVLAAPSNTPKISNTRKSNETDDNIEESGKSKKKRDIKDNSGAPSESTFEQHIDTELFQKVSEDIEAIQRDLIISVSSDQTITIHDSSSLKDLDTIIGYNEEIVDVSFISSSQIAVAANSTNVRIFTLPTFVSRTIGGNNSISPDSLSIPAHKLPILAMAVSPCKEFIVTGSQDQTLLLWSITLGKSVAILTGHTQAVTTVAFFNRTSKYIVSGSRDLTWKIWDVSEIIDKGSSNRPTVRVAGSMLTVKCHSKDVNIVAVSPNDQILATGSQDKEIKIFSLADVKKRVVKELAVFKGHRRGIWDLAFSPTDQVLASSSADMTIKLWNLSDFSCIKTFEGHTASVLRIRFITNGLQLLSAGADGLIKLWDIRDNECINSFDKHSDKIWALAIEPGTDGQRFVSGGGDSMLCYWNDHTEYEEEQESLKRDQQIMFEQSLQNFVSSKQYSKAFSLALSLDKPLQAYNIIVSVITESEHTVDDSPLLDMINKLDFDLVHRLLLYIRDWNTSAKSSLVAQSILYYIFHIYKASSFLKTPTIKEILEALIPYSQRHFQRIDQLLQSSYIIDYTLQAMNLLPELPDEPNKLDLNQGTLSPKSNSETISNPTILDESLPPQKTMKKRKRAPSI